MKYIICSSAFLRGGGYVIKGGGYGLLLSPL